jgi:hypothetical protein
MGLSLGTFLSNDKSTGLTLFTVATDDKVASVYG